MSKAADTIYRVVRLPQQLRTEIQTARDANGQTNEQFVAAAVEQHLPRITDSLRSLGFGGFKGETVPVRLPFSDDSGTLSELKDTSELVGIPAVQLLSVCLSASVAQAKHPAKRQGRPASPRKKPKARRSSTRAKGRKG